jgi:hypothetical protein
LISRIFCESQTDRTVVSLFKILMESAESLEAQQLSRRELLARWKETKKVALSVFLWLLTVGAGTRKACGSDNVKTAASDQCDIQEHRKRRFAIRTPSRGSGS